MTAYSHNGQVNWLEKITISLVLLDVCLILLYIKTSILPLAMMSLILFFSMRYCFEAFRSGEFDVHSAKNYHYGANFIILVFVTAIYVRDA
jgi:hypothetical protein